MTDYFILPRPPEAELREIREMVGHEPGETYFASLLRALRAKGPTSRLATMLAESRARAVSLADRCQTIEDTLAKKRAECDELRDKLAAVAARVERFARKQ